MTRVLVIDNYDSFVYTLAGYLQELGAETTVIRNDVIANDQIVKNLSEYDAVLISPGPGTPRDAGISIPVVREAAQRNKPLLGVCLGHQAIAEAFGAVVTNANDIMHGKTSVVTHDSSPLFQQVAQPFTATRYHSLAVVDATVPASLTVTARTDDGVIMALQHTTAPIFGVQFHPESVLTQDGYQMLGNWLEIAGLVGAARKANSLSPLVKLGSENR